MSKRAHTRAILSGKSYCFSFLRYRASLISCIPDLEAYTSVADEFHLRNGKQNKQEGQDGPVLLTWLLDKFLVNRPFGSREEVQYRFTRWWTAWISNQNGFSYFWCTSPLDTSSEVFGSGEKVRSRFSTWLLGRSSWSSDQNDWANFDLQVTPILPVVSR